MKIISQSKHDELREEELNKGQPDEDERKEEEIRQLTWTILMERRGRSRL